MQIFPTDRSASPSAFFSNMDYSGQSVSSFLDAMSSALDSVSAGESLSASTSLADESSQPLVESPYTRHTTDGVTYSLEEVTFTKSELEELREQLLKEGAPEASLQQFDVLVSQPDGATLAQVMASLMGNRANNLSSDDAHAITSLLGRIDPSGALATDAIALMREGNGAGAWDLIQNALGQMSANDGIDITTSELLALGRGLGLNADALRGLGAGMGGHDSLTINAGQFDALMNPAKNYFMEQAANAQKLDAALEKTLKPIISKARDRMEKEQEAAALQNKRVAQSKVLIDRTVQERSRQMLDDTATGQADANDLKEFNETMARKLSGKEIPGATAFEPVKTVQKDMSEKASNAQGAANVQNQKNEAAGNLYAQARDGQQGKNSQNGSQDSARQGTSDVWQDLLGKVETKPMQAPVQTAPTNSFVYSMLNGNLPNGMLADQPQAANNQQPQLARQVANQVQQGMLSAMRDGTTRLELQLHPAELGAVAVTLIARNGEVTAKLTSEKSETAEMLQRQIDTMRVNLEQQGVKVDKIEVALQNQRDNGEGTFQDLGQHNARQEENARQQELNRLRNLANVRNNGINEENEGLAQSLHNIAQTARYAGQSVHIVA